jgi:hypothetical protein
VIGGGSTVSFLSDVATLFTRGVESGVDTSLRDSEVLGVTGGAVVVVVCVTATLPVGAIAGAVVIVAMGVDVTRIFDEDPAFRGERGGDDVGDDTIEVDFGESMPLKPEELIEPAEVDDDNLEEALAFFPAWLKDALLITVTPALLVPFRDVPGAFSRAAQYAIRSFTEKILVIGIKML